MEVSQGVGVDRFEFVVVGGGPAGEAAANLARERGASVAVVERALVGGECPFFACMPSKTLLHAAGIHALGGDYPWAKASARRDWMIEREGRDVPDDSNHVRALEGAGATVIRGQGRLDGPGRVAVDTADGGRVLEAAHIVLAVGSQPSIPRVEGLENSHAWTTHEATGTRSLPRSLVVLGGGPSGSELAQVFARYGVPVALAHPHDRLNDRDHPRNSAALEAALRGDGVDVRTSARASRIIAGGGGDGAHRVEMADGTFLDGHEILVSTGRRTPLERLGLESVGIDTSGRLRPDDHLRIADEVYVAGDAAGGELFTHVAHYEGEMAVRIALGEDVRVDLRAVPRATYTEPETAGVGLLVEQARAQGIDAFEVSIDLAKTAKGEILDSPGHVTIVVDRGAQQLVGAFAAGPAAAEALHEAVLAIRARVPLAVLADTIHAFPSLARVFGSAFVDAQRHQGA